MVEIIGAENIAKCFTDVVEAAAFEQIKAVCDEAAFKDCVNTVLGAAEKKSIASDDDLLAYQNKMKERKGTHT